MMGFQVGFWDYVTFAALAVTGVAVILFMILILGLPGRIAIARKHPEAEAVNLMGWLGFLAVVPWIQALIWAFKPTDVVDIRRFPREEARATEEEIMRISGKSRGEGSKESKEDKTKHKPDLRQAAALVEMARQTVVVVGSQLYPQVGAPIGVAGTLADKYAPESQSSDENFYGSNYEYVGIYW